MDCYNVFPTRFFYSFFYVFFKIIFVNFILFILRWLRITITSNISKAKLCGGKQSTVAFLTQHRGLLQCFLIWFFFPVFFVMIFSKIIFVDFFLILSCLEFNFLIFFFKILWIATGFPYMVFLFFLLSFFLKLSLLIFFYIELI